MLRSEATPSTPFHQALRVGLVAYAYSSVSTGSCVAARKACDPTVNAEKSAVATLPKTKTHGLKIGGQRYVRQENFVVK